MYPRPKQIGGTLIRQIVRAWNAKPTSQILCAISGGSDSLALAHLIVHYGRKVAPRGGITLLHINHGWRGEGSDADEKHVRDCAGRWNVPLEIVRLDPRSIPRGESWEDAARRERKKIYAKFSKERGGAPVFTAHHADDVAETLLWRLFTGASQTHGAGILPREGAEFRPLLGIRKTKLVAYLREEGLTWREDPTNSEGRFLRSRLRRDLMPLVETLFPQAVQHLVELGRGAERTARKEAPQGYELGSVFFRLVDGRIRRAHWEALDALQSKRRGELHLPNGWTLKREKERWILERSKRNI